jgi:molybdenum ABC transporter molybdate-binding protein
MHFCKSFLIFLLSIGIFSFSPKFLKADEKPNLIILSASSIATPLAKIGRDFAKENNVNLFFVFDDTKTKFIKLITDGEPADIIISEDKELFRQLKQIGVLNVLSETNVAKNKLVFVESDFGAKVNNKESFENKIKLINKNKRLLIGDEENSYLNIKAFELIKYFKKLNKNINNFIEVYDNNEAFYQLSNRELFGIFYLSQVYNEKNINIIKEIDNSLFVDEDIDFNITYRCAIIAGDEQKLAEMFQKELKTPKSKKIFEEFGFTGV